MVYIAVIFMLSTNAKWAAVIVAKAPPSECPAMYSFRFLPSSPYSFLIVSYMPPLAHTVSTPSSKPCKKQKTNDV